ncbi:Alginate biosynthesis protein AlgA [Comamonas sp. PE63]|uniref:mannose-1-phosphate guanylyltransferase n=2 Tax=Comamonas brasiliensis TaxID=1812482 RepID=A0ABS5LQS0_9BURK|nr:Alginate biosynthesis protein AlgA [Comamonas sp. PE63]
MIPVILSGGSGTRLWPLSRESYPKQFLSLASDKSLFQQTIARLDKNIVNRDSPIVIGNQEHRFLIAEQCRAVGVTPKAIILEPFGRNTAVAIACACIQVQEDEPEALLLVMPADHVINDIDALNKAVDIGSAIAKTQNRIVTFGVVPHSAETGYGYIRVEKKESIPQAAAEFVEKPDQATAQKYYEDGRFYWNSGIFLFRASVMLQQMQVHAPDVLESAKASMQSACVDMDFLRLNVAEFEKSPNISIDYAVMEKSDSVSVVPLDAGWSDIGAWSAVWDISKKDDKGNAAQGEVILHESNNNYIHAENRLVSVLGVDNIIVIETKDAVMVAKKERSQDVKKIVDSIKKLGKSQATSHRQVYRPWGHYDSVDSGERYQVKRILVTPGQKLSVQMHHHRSEHWIVVAGTAKVSMNGVETLVTENQSVYIPVGTIHSLENPGKIPLEIIEVQSGAYLREDDIIRYSDKYGRVSV